MDRITPKAVDRVLREHLRHRSDLGLGKLLAGRILEAQNPFETRPQRKPQRWFLLFTASSAAALAAFVYFNFLN
jgi:hypothetical protein